MRIRTRCADRLREHQPFRSARICAQVNTQSLSRDGHRSKRGDPILTIERPPAILTVVMRQLEECRRQQAKSGRRVDGFAVILSLFKATKGCMSPYRQR
ncbi:hypothetical protein KIN20_008350 [Parelaphostrongylus tenuis]|uniref:Uncharacterized protein n=1 Tax=Parelaphostrongylus tenuis TaxID=148309 RepID=A0AAD5MNS2_PARTN|nr:hypothetical protein KIN20_008350 [Parelaphostrongylus tenuis]